MVDQLDFLESNIPYSEEEWEELQKDFRILRKQMMALIYTECVKQGKTLEDIEVCGLPPADLLPLYEEGRTDTSTFYLYQVFRALEIPIKI